MAAHDNVAVERHVKLISLNVSTNPQTPLLNGTWPATPPPSVLTNPFLKPTRQEGAAGSESMSPPQYCYDGPRYMVSIPSIALCYGANNNVNQTVDGQPPCEQCLCCDKCPVQSDPYASSPARCVFFTPCLSQSVRHSYAEQTHDYFSAPLRDAPLPRGRELDSCGYGQPSWGRAKSAPQRLSSRTVRGLYGQ